MKKFQLRLLVSSFIGAVYFFYLVFSEVGNLDWKTDYFIYLIFCMITANLVGFTMYISDQKLNKWMPWKDYASGRLIIGFLSHLLLSLTVMLVATYLFFALYFDDFSLQDLFTVYRDPVIKLSIITSISALMYSIIYFALHSYNQYAIVHVDAMKNQRNQLQLQFEALKSQLSPHYLFNSLNTISSLVYKDAQLAEDFIRRLAQTYQYILNNNSKQFVTLAEEVEFVKSYNYLLQVRFQNNLHLDINLPPNILNSRIPPLTLQMLVENAVKHNIINKDQPLSIYISAIDNTDIRISNTKTEIPASVSSFQVGLDNIKKRYAYFTDKKIKVDDRDKFTVTLPVLKNELAQSA